MYFEPGQNGPVVMGFVDANGAIRPRGLGRNMNALPAGVAPGPELPDVGRISACACGRHNLPPTQNIVATKFGPSAGPDCSCRTGDSERAPSNRSGGIRVLAACQGKGFLDSVLSVQTFADVDGKFVLHGLTPGNPLCPTCA